MHLHTFQTKTLLYTVAATLLSTVGASAAIPGLCNTGFSAATCTGLVPTGNGTTNDGNWFIAQPAPFAPSGGGIIVPCSGANACGVAGPTYVPAWVDFPDPSWTPDNKLSEWITPQVENSNGGQYIYATTFPVPAGMGHVTIYGALESDNETYAIYLSSGASECIPVAGYPVNNNPVNSVATSFSAFTNFHVTNAVVTPGGTATLYFIVRNRGVGGSDLNPTDTGLRVQFNQKTSVFKP